MKLVLKQDVPVEVRVVAYEGEGATIFQGKPVPCHNWQLVSVAGLTPLEYACSALVHVQLLDSVGKNVVLMSDGKKINVTKTGAVPQMSAEEKKWYDINYGKCRHGFAILAFEMKMPPNSETADLVNKWAEFSMTGTFKS